MSDDPELPQWKEVKDSWDAFLKNCSAKQQRALSYFLLGTESSKSKQQFDEICKQIKRTWKVRRRVREEIASFIRDPVRGKMHEITYRDLTGDDHTRFIYEDPCLGDRARFFAELGPVRAKDPLRCAQKLVRERQWTDSGGSPEKWLGADPWWQRVYDLAAFRVVYNFLGDISQAAENLPKQVRRVGYHCVNKDYIWDIDEARKRGARSIHMILTTPAPEKRVLEVQLMTMLQLAWDQSEHVIEYEQKRLQREEAESRRMKRQATTNTMIFSSLSDLLYIADETFDRIYQAQREPHKHYVK